MKHSTTEISEQLVHLLQDKFGITNSSLVTSNWDEPLTGSVIHLSEVDLVYLFFEIEKHFRVRINEHSLESYGFCSMRQVTLIIEQALETEESNEKPNGYIR